MRIQSQVEEWTWDSSTPVHHAITELHVITDLTELITHLIFLIASHVFTLFACFVWMGGSLNFCIL